MVDRWAYIGHSCWVPGQNIPALQKGGFQGGFSLNAAGLQLFGNCVTNASKLSDELRRQAYTAITGSKTVANIDAVTLISVLGGVSRKTARSWFQALNDRGWVSAFTHCSTGDDHGEAMAAVGAMEAAVGAVEAAMGEEALPEVLPPAVVDAAEDELPEDDCEDIDYYLDSSLTAAPRSQSKLQKWRGHPNYAIGMRLADLATMHGWQKCTLSKFTCWLTQQLPNSIGNLNLSERWLTGFQASLIQACHTCTTSSLHAVLPATGTPSFLSRIVDVVSINSHSLLPTIQVFTTCEGKLSWALLGCPCLERIIESGEQDVAVGTAPRRFFGFHSADQLIKTVHRVEESFRLGRSDRAFRLLVTVADQAIQGEGSVRFTKKERILDELAPDPLGEGVCKFHIADGVGCNVDKRYGETFIFDRLLRLVRRHFAFGTGHLIYRGVATKFSGFVQTFRDHEQQCLEAVAKAEADGQPLAAARLRREASKARGEAAAIIRAGWDTWRRPQAPRADGTRKAVYQNKARASFFDSFGLTFWGLQARMQQSLETARVARLAKGKQVTANTGLRTKEMKAWRSLGRAMLDIRVLVFNLGRIDFRKKHLAAYALECQTSLQLLPGCAAYDCSKNMLAAVGALVEMQGIVRMMGQLGSGFVFEQRGNCGVVKQGDRGPWAKKGTATTWWTTCRTLLAHRCWRYFPKLAVKLPEILLGGSLNGVKLQSQTFLEPGTTPAFSQLHKWDRGARLREERFEKVLQALGCLIHWAGAERRLFMSSIMGVAPPTSKRVAQGLDKDLPRLDDAEVAGVHVVDEPDESADEQTDEVPVPCSFVIRPAVGSLKAACGRSVGSKPAEGNHLVDMITEGILPAETVAAAAFELDTECEKLHGVPIGLTASDIASVLRSTHDDDGNDTSSHEDTEDSLDPDSSPPVVDGVDPKSNAARSETAKSKVVSRDEVERLGEAYMARKVETNSKEEQRRAFLALPRHDWIIVRGKKTGKILCLHSAVHEQLWQTRCVAQMPPREQFIIDVGNLFDKTLFLASPLEDLRQPLAALHQQCSQRVWGLNRDKLSYDINSVMRDPPNELFSDITTDDLAQEYSRLRMWLQSLKDTPYGHEFYVPTSFLVKVVGVDGEPVGQPFHLPPDHIDASRWPHRHVPRLPTMATARKYGAVQILQVERKPDIMKFYQYTMSTCLREIRCRGIWHIVMGWHVYVHVAMSSESLAESVGSMLGATRRHNITGNMAMKHLVWSSQLKAIGLEGFGGEEGIMAYALNTHFQCDSPEGWHFLAKRVVKHKRTAAELQKEVRLLSKPAWFHTYLHDLIATGGLTLCKHLPRPEMAVLSPSEVRASRWRQLTTTAKRQKIAEHAEDQYNPKRMHDELWQKLGITTLSLPTCLRPGQHAR